MKHLLAQHTCSACTAVSTFKREYNKEASVSGAELCMNQVNLKVQLVGQARGLVIQLLPPPPQKKIALCRILLKNLNKHHFNSYHFMICIVSKQLPPRLFFYPKIHLSPKIAAGYMSGVGLQFLGMLAGRVKNN